MILHGKTILAANFRYDGGDHLQRPIVTVENPISRLS